MNPDHEAIVMQGAQALNQWRIDNPAVELDLSGSNLECVQLNGADLHGANFTNAELTSIMLIRANCDRAIFVDADLSACSAFEASFADVRFTRTKLHEANLNFARFQGAELQAVTMKNTHMVGTLLTEARIWNSRIASSAFWDADLRLASVLNTHFQDTDFQNANFRKSRWAYNSLNGCRLQKVRDAALIDCRGPCSIGLDTLIASEGLIDPTFLRSCGVPAWLVAAARLCLPTLTAAEADQISARLLQERFAELSLIGSVFISYSRRDGEFVKKLHRRLRKEKLAVFLDRPDLRPGNIQRQLTRAIRSRHIVIVVLSQHSLLSDWVWTEIATARAKEKEDGRDILCPVAIDDSWTNPGKYDAAVQKAVEEHQVELGRLTQMHIIQFDDLRQFTANFQKLLEGLAQNYGTKPGP